MPPLPQLQEGKPPTPDSQINYVIVNNNRIASTAINPVMSSPLYGPLSSPYYRERVKARQELAARVAAETFSDLDACRPSCYALGDASVSGGTLPYVTPNRTQLQLDNDLSLRSNVRFVNGMPIPTPDSAFFAAENPSNPLNARKMLPVCDLSAKMNIMPIAPSCGRPPLFTENPGMWLCGRPPVIEPELPIDSRQVMLRNYRPPAIKLVPNPTYPPPPPSGGNQGYSPVPSAPLGCAGSAPVGPEMKQMIIENQKRRQEFEALLSQSNSW
jgi:hypothetical protein